MASVSSCGVAPWAGARPMHVMRIAETDSRSILTFFRPLCVRYMGVAWSQGLILGVLDIPNTFLGGGGVSFARICLLKFTITPSKGIQKGVCERFHEF